MRGVFCILVSSALLSGCAYSSSPIVAGNFDVVTSYSSKLPGKYLLYVSTDQLDTVVRPNEIACSAHSFPIKAADGFKGSLRATLSNLMGSVEVVDQPPSLDKLASLHARGLITVRADRLDGRIRALPGFWSATLATEVQITASIAVDGPSGRLYGSTFEGLGKAEAGAGAFCDGGAKSLGESTEKAIKEIVRKMGEGVANSDRVRNGRGA